MVEFIRAHWPWIVAGLVVIGIFFIGVSEYLDAATSLLPGGGTGTDAAISDGVGK